LARVNEGKFYLTVALFVVQLTITISSPFLTNYLIEDYMKDNSGLLVVLLAIFLGYKLIKNTVGIICDFCYQSLGYEYFARLYWHILTA
jgi:ABC-type bacteriocin/lantibiotic exporter with double-glycine peptidase domain